MRVRLQRKQFVRVITLETFVAYMLVLCPIFGVYQTFVSGVNFGEIMLILICFLSLSISKETVKLRSLILFAMYSLCTTVIMTAFISYADLLETLKETISFTLYVVIIVFLSQRLSVEIIMNAFVKVARIAAIFLIVQFVVYLLFGVWLPGIIPGLMTDSGMNSSDIIRNYSRPCSFFQEPSHYSQYLAFPLAFEVFKEKKNLTDKYTIVLFLLSILMNFTGNGILIIAVIIALYILNNVWTVKVKKLMKGFTISIIAVVATIYILSKTSIGEEIILRITSGELLGNNITIYGNSGYIRAVRGYVVFGKFDFIHKLLGVGFGNYESYAIRNAYNALTSKTLFTFSYLNGIQYYLASTGIIGLILYLRVLFHGFKRNDAFKRKLSILFIAMSSIAALVNGPIWALAIIILYSIKNNNHLEREINYDTTY